MEFLDQLNFCELLKEDPMPWFSVAYYVIILRWSMTVGFIQIQH